MAGDPTIRGLTGALETGLAGVKRGQVKLDSTERPFNLISQTVEDVLTKGTATFSWRELVSDKPLTDADRRAFIEFKPMLDFKALEPGKDATDAIRQAAVDLNLARRIRRPGAADRPGSDRQRGILDRAGRRDRQRHRHRAGGAVHPLDGAAFVEDHLRGVRQSVHRAVDHHRGRPDDGRIAEPAVDRLRRAVRRPRRRFRHPVQRPLPFGALQERRSAARRWSRRPDYSAVPLSLAAMATAAGFLSFLPTDYKGISELGKIAGAGMLIAFLTSITVLPALLKLLNPPGESEPVGYAFLAPVDRVPRKASRRDHRRHAAASSVAGLPLLYFMKFDFNPINLRNPKVESIATFLDLRKDPNTGANAINVMTHVGSGGQEDRGQAGKAAGSVCARCRSTVSCPTDQPAKLKLIAKAAPRCWSPRSIRIRSMRAPTDRGERRGAEEFGRQPAQGRRRRQGAGRGRLAAAGRRAVETRRSRPGDARQGADRFRRRRCKIVFDQLRNTLQAEPVTLEDLPPDICRAGRPRTA